MGRKKGPPKEKKSEFDALPPGFKDAIDSSTTDKIRERVSEIALLDAETKKLLKEDPEVQQIRDALKLATEDYRENIKSYRLQIKYCSQVINDAGGGAKVKTVAAAVQGILDPDGTGETKVSHKPLGSTEYTQLTK